jgi:hypothetical protein
VLYFRVGFDGVETSRTVPKLGPRVRSSFDEVFLRLYAKKTIAQLTDIADDGTFIVSATDNESYEYDCGWVVD